MADRFQFCRGTAAQWTTANPVLRNGEPGWETDTLLMKIGDGVTAWNSLPYREFSPTSDTLALNSVSDPSAPTDGLLFYAKNIAGRRLPKFMPPSGLDSPLQPAIFGNGMRIVSPGSSAALSYIGMGAFVAVGTISHPTLVAGTLRETTNRAIVTSAATANSAAGLRSNTQPAWRGNGAGLGGFFSVFRFGASDAVSTKRILVGYASTSAAIATTQEPSALLNFIAVANDAADANLQLMHNDGAGTATKINLGSDFVKNQANGMYELTLFCKPNDSKISYRVKRLDAAGEVSGEISTDLFSTTTMMYPHFYANNGGTATAVVLDFYRYYHESDY
jgi:hypothetical protein